MKRRTALIIVLALIFASASLPAFSFAATSEETQSCDAWIVQLSSPLPSALGGEDGDSPVEPVHEGQKLYLVTDPELLEMLQEEGMVDWAEPDMEVELFADGETAVEISPVQWPLDMLNIPRADALGCYGQGVRVAVIDSGCAAHKELSHALLPGHNFITGTDDVTDNIGHGTFVSGLISAADDGVGAIGAAPEAKIVPLKCFDTGYSTRVSVLTEAIYAAVDEYGCNVLNMSFGLKSYSKTLDTAITYAEEKGAVCVASAGNYGNATLYYPAALPNVIGVGSVDSDEAVSSFSQRNESLTVMAPGRGVYSLTAGGDYTTKNGTSFSAPLVSALCARLLAADDSLTPRELMQLLTATAKDLGSEGYDTDYGYGLADLESAMDLMLGGREVFLSPFRVVGDDVFITLLNNGSEKLVGQCLLTRYREGLMEDIAWEDISLQPGESVTISLPDQSNLVKCSFWSDLSDITPITPYRECEVSS